MLSQTQTTQLQSMLRGLINQESRTFDIVDLRLNEDRDQDGDPVLFVQVIYGDPKAKPAANERLTILRRAMETVREQFPDLGYPALSYVPKTELRTYGLETTP